MTNNSQLTERIAHDVDALLQLQTATKGSKVTRLRLERDRLVVTFAPIIDGECVTTDRTVDIMDMLRFYET